MTVPSIVQSSKPVERSENLYRPHPGEVFTRRILNKTTLKQPEMASLIGISVKHLSRFANGHVSVTADLARKLEACTNISAEAWLHYQIQYDLYKTPKIERSAQTLTA